MCSYLELRLGDSDGRRRGEAVDDRVRYVLDDETWRISQTAMTMSSKIADRTSALRMRARVHYNLLQLIRAL